MKKIILILLLLNSKFSSSQNLTFDNIYSLINKSEEQINEFMINKGWTLNTSDDNGAMWEFDKVDAKKIIFGLGYNDGVKTLVLAFDDEKVLAKLKQQFSVYKFVQSSNSKLECGFLKIYNNQKYEVTIMYNNKNFGCNWTNKIQLTLARRK